MSYGACKPSSSSSSSSQCCDEPEDYNFVLPGQGISFGCGCPPKPSCRCRGPCRCPRKPKSHCSSKTTCPAFATVRLAAPVVPTVGIPLTLVYTTIVGMTPYSIYNGATGLVTIPTDAPYVVTAHTSFLGGETPANVIVAIVANGMTLTQTNPVVPAGAAIDVDLSIVYPLYRGQTVSVVVTTDSTVTVTPVSTNFSLRS